MSKNFLLKNTGLRIVAFLLAIVVWAMITGRERSFSERTMEVSVEYFGVSSNIHIRDVNPNKVQVQFRATSRQMEKITPEDFKIRIDLAEINDSGRIIKFTNHLLEHPDGIEIISIFPKLIEISAAELITREVDVRIRYKGRMKPRVLLLDRYVVPKKVRIFGYKTQIADIQNIEGAEMVNLGEIEESQVIRIPLKKSREILKFEDSDTVEVHIKVDNRNKLKEEKQDQPEAQKDAPKKSKNTKKQ